MNNYINTRRQFLQACAGSAVVGTVMPSLAFSKNAPSDKILVVIELSGANDGLNTLVPYSNDAYYKLRPQIGIPAQLSDLETALRTRRPPGLPATPPPAGLTHQT